MTTKQARMHFQVRATVSSKQITGQKSCLTLDVNKLLQFATKKFRPVTKGTMEFAEKRTKRDQMRTITVAETRPWKKRAQRSLPKSFPSPSRHTDEWNKRNGRSFNAWKCANDKLLNRQNATIKQVFLTCFICEQTFINWSPSVRTNAEDRDCGHHSLEEKTGCSFLKEISAKSFASKDDIKSQWRWFIPSKTLLRLKRTVTLQE